MIESTLPSTTSGKLNFIETNSNTTLSTPQAKDQRNCNKSHPRLELDDIMNDNSKNTTSTNLDTDSIEKEIEHKNTSVKTSINQEEDKVNSSDICGKSRVKRDRSSSNSESEIQDITKKYKKGIEVLELSSDASKDNSSFKESSCSSDSSVSSTGIDKDISFIERQIQKTNKEIGFLSIEKLNIEKDIKKLVEKSKRLHTKLRRIEEEITHNSEYLLDLHSRR